MAKTTTYQGPERRVHKVYVTRNTEYHVRKGVCVAVKERKGTEWVETHGAIRMKLQGHVKIGAMLPLDGPPKLGNRLYFADRHSDVLTSALIAVVRPPKMVVSEYPHEN